MARIEQSEDNTFRRVPLSPCCAVDSLGDHVVKFEDEAKTDCRAVEMRAIGGGMKRVTVIRYERKNDSAQNTTEVEIIHAPDPTKPIQASLRFTHFMDAHDCLVPMITYGILTADGERILCSVHLPAGRYILPENGLISPVELESRISTTGQSYEWLRAQNGHMLAAVQQTERGHTIRIPSVPVLDRKGISAYHIVNATMPPQGVHYDHTVYELIGRYHDPRILDLELRRLGFDVRLTLEEKQAAAIQFLLQNPPAASKDDWDGSDYAMG